MESKMIAITSRAIPLYILQTKYMYMFNVKHATVETNSTK